MSTVSSLEGLIVSTVSSLKGLIVSMLPSFILKKAILNRLSSNSLTSYARGPQKWGHGWEDAALCMVGWVYCCFLFIF